MRDIRRDLNPFYWVKRLFLLIAKFLRNSEPIFFENSRIPGILSMVAPLKIGAICIGPVVFARYNISDQTKRHETIHWQQCIDLLLLGTAIVYVYDWIKGLVKYRADFSGTNPRGTKYTSVGNKAYFRTRAEQEANESDHDPDYLKSRKRWAWLRKYKV